MDCLIGIHNGKASLDILDHYDKIRRDIYENIVNVTSTENLQRIRQDADNAAESDEFFLRIAGAENNSKVVEGFVQVSFAYLRIVGPSISLTNSRIN